MKKQAVRMKKLSTDVEILEKKKIFQGFFYIDHYKLRHKLFEGGWGPVVEREVFERGQAAAVLPYDPKTNQVVLIEQFRPGALQDEESPWVIEIIAGIIEPNETEEDLIRREAQEEAGIEVTDLTHIIKYYASPGATTETVSVYCGKTDSTKASGIHGIIEEGENIKVHVMDLDEALSLVNNGTINNAAAVIALQWLALNYTKIK